MKLRIKRRSQSQWLALYVFALPFMSSILIDWLFFPSAIKYTADLALVVLLLIAYMSKNLTMDPQAEKPLRIVIAFLLVSVIGLVLEYQSIIYYLWGIRNNIRFYVFFVVCALVMNRDTAEDCMRLLDGVFYLNLAITLYQTLVLHVHQDDMGGIFGFTKGYNGYTNIYLMIIVTLYMLKCMCNQVSLMKMVTRCGISLLIAAMTELKMFFFEFIIIAALSAMMTKFSFRKLIVIIGAAVGFVVGIQVLKMLFPYFSDWFKMESVLQYVSSKAGYTQNNDVNRLSAIMISWNKFLDTWPRKLFGLGLGNCDYSTNFKFLRTPFYVRHSRLNYVWFSSSFMILETGLIGLALYVYFFLSVYRAAQIVEKRDPNNEVYCKLARIMAIMALGLIIYNSSLRMECAYMLYFVLALPFIKEKGQKTLNGSKEKS